MLIDSGGQYLEGTTDVTRVIKVGKNISKIKYSYTYLLKTLIKIEKIFPRNLISSKIDLYIRNYLSKFKIYYSHGTGHVGNFGDVHENYLTISSRSKDILTNNNLFSIEPGHMSKDSREFVCLKNIK